MNENKRKSDKREGFVMYPELNQYSNLVSFLRNNGLVVRSCFAATDLDCAFRIQRADAPTEYGYPLDRDDLCVCFMVKPYDGVDFTWDLFLGNPTKEDLRALNVTEMQLIAEIKERLSGTLKPASRKFTQQ